MPSCRSQSIRTTPVPELTSTLSKQDLPVDLGGREERRLDVRIPLPEPSVRGYSLFDVEVELVISAELSQRIFTSSKTISIEMPLAVAAPGSLPKEALQGITNQPKLPLSPTSKDQLLYKSQCGQSPLLSSTITRPSSSLSGRLLPTPQLSPTPVASPLCASIYTTNSYAPTPISFAFPAVSQIDSPVLYPVQPNSPLPPLSPITPPMIPFNCPPKQDPFYVAIDTAVPLLTPSKVLANVGLSPSNQVPLRSSSEPSEPTRHRSSTRPPLPALPKRPTSSASVNSSHPASITPGSPGCSGFDTFNLYPRTQEKYLFRQNCHLDFSHSAAASVKTRRQKHAPLVADAVCAEHPSVALEVIGEKGESRVMPHSTDRLESSPSSSEPSIVSTSAVRPTGLPTASSVALLEEVVEQEANQQKSIYVDKTLPKPPSSIVKEPTQTHPSARTIFAPESDTAAYITKSASSRDVSELSHSVVGPEPGLATRQSSKPPATPTIKSGDALTSLERRLTTSAPIGVDNFLKPRSKKASDSVDASGRVTGTLDAGNSQTSSEALLVCDTPKMTFLDSTATTSPHPESQHTFTAEESPAFKHSSRPLTLSQQSFNPSATLSHNENNETPSNISPSDSVSNIKPKSMAE